MLIDGNSKTINHLKLLVSAICMLKDNILKGISSIIDLTLAEVRKEEIIGFLYTDDKLKSIKMLKV